jgi:hypothetical protein
VKSHCGLMWLVGGGGDWMSGERLVLHQCIGVKEAELCIFVRYSLSVVQVAVLKFRQVYVVDDQHHRPSTIDDANTTYCILAFLTSSQKNNWQKKTDSTSLQYRPTPQTSQRKCDDVVQCLLIITYGVHYLLYTKLRWQAGGNIVSLCTVLSVSER